MNSDWENPKRDEFDEGGGATLPQQADEAITLLEVFSEIPEPSKVEMEKMMKQMDTWADKFAALPGSDLKLKVFNTIINCQLTTSLAYMDMFLQLESPDEETCSYMHAMLIILQKRFEELRQQMQPETIESLRADMEEVVQHIATRYPDVILEDNEK